MRQDSLPPGWVTAPLGELARNRDSERIPVNAKERALRQGTVPYYGATGQVGWIDEHLFDEPLLLVGEDGVQFLDPLKPKAYLVKGPAWVNNHAHVLTALDGGVSLTYLKYYLDQFDYHGYANGTTRLKLTRSALDRIPVAVPPADEQVRVIKELERRLSHVDATERTLMKAQCLVESAVESTIHATVTGALTRAKHRQLPEQQLVPSSQQPANAPAVPSHWRWMPLRDTLREGMRNGRSAPTNRDGTGVRVYTITAVTRRDWGMHNTKWAVGDAEQLADLFVQDGDLFVQRSNTPELVGTSALFRGPGGRATFPDLLIRLRTNDEILPEWLEAVLRWRYTRDYLRSVASGLSGSMPKIDQAKVGRVLVPLPPVDEQKVAIAEMERRLSLLEDVASAIESQLRRVGSVRIALVRAAVAGELVAQEPSDESAATLLARLADARDKAASRKARRTKESSK